MHVLGRMGVPPDFESDAGLRYTHRIDGGTDIYFVANPEDRALAANCAFRVQGKQPELWDAVTGTSRNLSEFAVKDGRTSVPLRFEAHQSFIVVFRTPAAKADLAGRNFPGSRTLSELTGSWDVSFDPKWGGPERITFQALDDWSRRREEGIKFYSGKAIYRKSFDLPPESQITNRESRIALDLGVVKNLAQVRLNGRDQGVVWCAPWRVEITDVVKPAGNELEIVVANLWPNRLIGDEHLPPDCEYNRGGSLTRWPDWLVQDKPRPSQGRFAFATWKHFSRESPLLPSGLLGPVTLRQWDP
jgi:hypothetical protein